MDFKLKLVLWLLIASLSPADEIPPEDVTESVSTIDLSKTPNPARIPLPLFVPSEDPEPCDNFDFCPHNSICMRPEK
jgi:hypothetical protein